VRFPVRISLRRSNLFLLLSVFLHMLAVASVCILPWPVLVRGALVGFVTLSLCFSLRPTRVCGLRLGERGDLRVSYAAGDSAVVSVCPDTTVFHCLVVLRFRDERSRVHRLVLLSDSMSAIDFRQLRLWLRWRRVTVDELATGGA
jgi:hypothetical protein